MAGGAAPSQLGAMKRHTILDEILATKREEVARLQLFRSAIRAQAEDAPPPLGFESALRKPGEVAVVAEFKRRSPSAGDLNPYAQVAGVASVYAAGGAAAISILTDEPYFGGSLDDLRAVRGAVGVPLLRKDFTLDPVQLYEARAAGADAVLLIVRALGDTRLRELLGLSAELGLAAVVEAHDEEEIGRALEAGARIVGVNARGPRHLRRGPRGLAAAHRGAPGRGRGGRRERDSVVGGTRRRRAGRGPRRCSSAAG